MINANKELPRLTPGIAYAGPEFAGCVNSGRRPVIKVPAIRSCGGRKKSLGWILVGDETECDLGWWGHEDFKWLYSGKRGKHPTRRLWKFRGRATAISKFQSLIDVVLGFNQSIREGATKARNKIAQAKKTGDHNAWIEGHLELNDAIGIE